MISRTHLALATLMVNGASTHVAIDSGIEDHPRSAATLVPCHDLRTQYNLILNLRDNTWCQGRIAPGSTISPPANPNWSVLVFQSTAVSCSLVPEPTSFCANGVPQPFSECGYEAFNSYQSATVPAGWADEAIKKYISRKGWPSSTDFKVISVPVACVNEYESRAWAMLIEAEIDGTKTYIQARPYGSSSESTPKFDCIDNICVKEDRVSDCDRDDDDDDDDNDD